jgi:glutamine synthetase
MLMAGLDGVINKIEPPDPVDVDLYELLSHNSSGGPQIQSTPGSLPEVLEALEGDHEFLLRGGVFTDDIIAEWISYKREREVDPIALRPHPYEFHLYYDKTPYTHNVTKARGKRLAFDTVGHRI